MDPLDFRLKNTGRNGDISPLNGKPVATLGISDCLEEGRERFRWDERKAACKAFNEEAVRTAARCGAGSACPRSAMVRGPIPPMWNRAAPASS